MQEADFENSSKAPKANGRGSVAAGNVAALNAADAAKKRAEALIAEAMSQVGARSRLFADAHTGYESVKG